MYVLFSFNGVFVLIASFKSTPSLARDRKGVWPATSNVAINIIRKTIVLMNLIFFLFEHESDESYESFPYLITKTTKIRRDI